MSKLGLRTTLKSYKYRNKHRQPKTVAMWGKSHKNKNQTSRTNIWCGRITTVQYTIQCCVQ